MKLDELLNQSGLRRAGRVPEVPALGNRSGNQSLVSSTPIGNPGGHTRGRKKRFFNASDAAPEKSEGPKGVRQRFDRPHQVTDDDIEQPKAWQDKLKKKMKKRAASTSLTGNTPNRSSR